MSNDIVVKADHVSKKFCRGLRHVMLYGAKDIACNMAGLSSHSEKLRNGEFWAVDDISFELRRGETLGLIGPNGSGKSTLLKMVNGIFMPDKGKIEIKGRVGALIEVGAGFHPMLTGRENIYINGSILGMSKREIDQKFDEIVEFADIGEFIDAPVKHYSSGMYVRLGFAVAVHCEPDILLVDEVMAVGDSVFRNKCYQKMNEIKKKRDVAIIFVSHDLLSVEKFCNKGMFISNGKMKRYGEIHQVIQNYQSAIIQLLNEKKNINNIVSDMPYCTKDVEITDVNYLGKDSKEQKDFAPGDTFAIIIKYKANRTISNPIFQIALLNREGLCISIFGTHIDKIQIKSIQGTGEIECRLKELPFLLNKYYATVAIYDKTHNITFDYWNGAISNQYFHVLPDRTSEKMSEYTPLCRFSTEWRFN